MEIKNENGKLKTVEELYDEAKEMIVDELDNMDSDDALKLGNAIRDCKGYETLYENNEENINEQLEDWNPWDIIQLNYDDYSDYFYMDYGEPDFTDDVWCDLDTDEIADDILNGDYRNYLTSDIKDIVDEYEDLKEQIKNYNPFRAEGEELLKRYVNCGADVTDLLQYIDRLVKNDDVWSKEEE